MATMWHERWATKNTGWDLNGPHPLTRYLIEKVAITSPEMVNGQWLIPGCGRGHDGPFLLNLGASGVEGRDLVPLAIDEASKLYGHIENLKFVCGDITQVAKNDMGRFDAIFDRAMMCALEGENRSRYIQACLNYLKPGGVFASLAFASTFQPEIGPPFQITEPEIKGLFKGAWRLEWLEERQDGACGQKILSEWVLIAQKA